MKSWIEMFDIFWKFLFIYFTFSFSHLKYQTHFYHNFSFFFCLINIYISLSILLQLFAILLIIDCPQHYKNSQTKAIIFSLFINNVVNKDPINNFFPKSCIFFLFSVGTNSIKKKTQWVKLWSKKLEIKWLAHIWAAICGVTFEFGKFI